MKEIIANVKPYLAERVVSSLADIPVVELIVREVKGYGRQKSYLEKYGDNEFALVFVARVEITLVVDDEHVDQAVSIISQVSRTGRLGDGKVMVLPIVQAVEDTRPKC